MDRKDRKKLQEKLGKYKDRIREGWLDTLDVTFGKFAASISHWPSGELKHSSKDIKRIFDIQYKRIKNNGYDVKWELLADSDSRSYSIASSKTSSSVYSNHTTYKSGIKNVSYFKNGKLVKKFKYPFILYANIIDVNNSEKINNYVYACPNCSNVVRIEDLLNGCEYCNTKFLMSDLYPVVNNYYDLYDISMKKTFFNKVLIITCLFSIILSVYNFFNVYNSGMNFFESLLLSFFNIFIYGFFIYLLSCSLFWLLFIIKVYIFSKTAPPFRTLFTGNKMERIICKYDKLFSYKYFEGKIVSMIKRIVLDDDPQQLPIFTGTDINNYKNILDVEYCGGMVLNKYYIKNSNLYFDLTVYMFDTINNNGNIIKKKHNYNVIVYKNIDAKENYGFSVEIVKCPGCGGSFDAEELKKCPYCEKNYDLSLYDYVIYSIK